MIPYGIYIHIPFCVRKCAYCDFYSIADPSRIPMFEQAITCEIAARASEQPWASAVADTIYIGGGTPSFVGAPTIVRILDAVRRAFPVADEAEVTVEINPASGSRELLDALKNAGVTRVSVGVQSFNDELLRVLGRAHSRADAIETCRAVKAVGFENYSIDVIHSVPGQTVDDLVSACDQIAVLQPTHVSAYGLSIEGGTPFAAAVAEKRIVPVGDDAQAEFIERVRQLLGTRGFSQYEISNFSRPGFESRHNLKYWQYVPYLGLGPAAHSFDGARRSWNAADIDAYCGMREVRSSGEELLTPRKRCFERIMLGLRMTREGVDLDAAIRESDDEGVRIVSEACQKVCVAGLMQINGSRAVLTERGMLLYNEVIRAFDGLL